MGINSVFLVGNLTREPELRSTASGFSVLIFGLAVNERRKNQSGEWEDRPSFFDCVVMGRRADALERILSKGSKVAVEGSLRQNTWEKDGQKRSKVEVIVEELDLMQRSGANSKAEPAPEPQEEYYELDLPF